MERKLILPAHKFSGSVRLPGDKSISHRYALLAAIARGTSKFENFSSAADCATTIACVRALGCHATHENGTVVIEGCGPDLATPAAALDCGNSGSTMRMLAGILAGQPFSSVLIGDESLTRRPMSRIIDPLRLMGAEIGSGENGRPPLIIQGGGLRSIEYTLPVASAQLKSCLLLAGLFADGTTVVNEPVRTRDHTELALRAFGADVERRSRRISVAGRQPLTAIEAYIPGDISSAAFFLCAAMLFDESNLVLDNLLLNPTRAVLLDVLTAMGARIQFLQIEEHHGETIGTLRIQHSGLRGTTIQGATSVALIDELPVLAAIAPFTDTGIEILDAAELRVKESDRISLVVKNLRAMGAEVEERPDGLRVPGGQQLHGAEIDAAGDHRIAMAFSVAALRAEGSTTIVGAEAVAVSYPQFFADLEQLLD